MRKNHRNLLLLVVALLVITGLAEAAARKGPNRHLHIQFLKASDSQKHLGNSQ